MYDNAMVSLFSFLHWELHLLPAIILLVFLLPFSSNHKIRYYGCFTFYVFVVSIVSTLLIPVFLLRFKDVRNSLMAAECLKYISKVVGIRWELRRGEILQEDRGAVVVSNHQSMFDILGLFSIWHVMKKCAPVARKEVFYVWPFGIAAWLGGIVFIDRLNGKTANKQLAETSDIIIKKKTKLWIFPEGTRNKKPDTFLPFKRGAFRLAISCQAPIIPVVFSPYYFLNAEKKIFGQGKIIITALDPILTEGLTEKDIDTLMEKTRNAMAKQYELLKQEVLSSEETVKC